MSAATTTAAPPHSAPNKLPGKDEKAWKGEIHTPQAEYNANLSVADIVPDPENRHEDKAGLQDLAAQIKAEGLLQPIVVRPVPRFPRAAVLRHVVDKKEIFRVVSDGQLAWTAPENKRLLESTEKREADRTAAIYQSGSGWQLIAGERRWGAHRLNNAPTIRAFIHRGETDVSAAVKQTIENLGRKDLNPLEEARQMKRLEDLKVPQKEIGKLFGGRSQPVVSNTLRVLGLPGPVQQMLATGEIDLASAVELVRFAPWRKVCESIAKRYVKTAWSAKDLRRQLPFDDDLVREKLAVDIPTERSYSYGSENEALYKVPAALQENPAFIKGYNCFFYLLPDDPKAPNLWEPERIKQDKDRVAAEAKEMQKATAAAKKGGKGKPTKEQLERKKKLDGNKARRAENDGTLAIAINELKASKGVNSTALAVICDHVLGDPEMGRVMEAAAALDIKLPKSLEADNVGYGESNAVLRSVGPEAMIQVTAAVIMFAQAANARKFSGEVPASTAFIAGKAAKSVSSTSVVVTVRSKGGECFAKAGEAKASSTSGEEGAATAAAAKHFTCSPNQIQLLRQGKADEDGESDKAVFTATKGGKKS